MKKKALKKALRKTQAELDALKAVQAAWLPAEGIDEITIYSGIVLSDEEIHTHFITATSALEHERDDREVTVLQPKITLITPRVGGWK